MANQYIPSKTDAMLRITQAAIDHLKQIGSDREHKLRVYVSGGGCSGFKYCFELDGEQEEDDTIIEKDGIAIAVDAMSLSYLQGSLLDYMEDLAGARFVVNNPLAATTCGCGASFSI